MEKFSDLFKGKNIKPQPKGWPYQSGFIFLLGRLDLNDECSLEDRE